MPALRLRPYLSPFISSYTLLSSSCSGRIRRRRRLFLVSVRGILRYDAPSSCNGSIHRRTSNAVSPVSTSGRLVEPFDNTALPRQQVLHANVIIITFLSLLSIGTNHDVWSRTQIGPGIGIHQSLMCPCLSLFETRICLLSSSAVLLICRSSLVT